MSVKKELEKKIIFIIAKNLKLKPLNVKKNLSLGDITQWDSLMHLNIFFSLKKKFNKINLENASKVKSVNDWINLINKNYND